MIPLYVHYLNNASPIFLPNQAEYEEKMLQAALKEQEMRFLEDQREQQRRERDRWGKEKFGDIGNGFFDGFGKSCR